LLCSGIVEMIANWVKKRAKYLLRGIRDLLDDVVPVDVMAADKARLQQMPTTAQTILLNPMLEKQRYDARLKAPVPTPPQCFGVGRGRCRNVRAAGASGQHHIG
jgi:hypothetical protein